MESKIFEIFKVARKNLVCLLDGLSNEELNYVPEGFNNSIIWNAGHILVTQQLLCYGLANQDLLLDAATVDKYRKGTTPAGIVSPTEVAAIKNQLVSVLDTFESDYQSGKFSAFKPYETSFGVPLTKIEDAIMFCNFHEGLHYGYILSQKRFVK